MNLFGFLNSGGLGSGAANQAAQIIQSRPYQMHVQEAKAMGQQPMSPEEFAKMMSQQQPPPPQYGR